MGRNKTLFKKYCKSWEEHPDFKDWIRPIPCDVKKAYCRYCKVKIVAHTASIKRHCQTTKHEACSKPFLQPDFCQIWGSKVLPLTTRQKTLKSRLQLT